jgi:hypothetical protein
MKKIILIFYCILFMCCSFAQACNDDVLMSIKGNWKKRGDANLRTGKDQSQIISRIDAISKLLQTAYPQPKGMEAGWYRSMEGHPLVSNGPLTYQLNSLYMPWYCNSYLHKPMLLDETDTWVFIYMNSFGWLITDQYDKAEIKVQGVQAWWLPKKVGEWRGLPVYESSGMPRNNKVVLITRSGQLPYKPVSRLQFLQAMKEKIESDKKTQLDFQNKRTVRSNEEEEIAKQKGLENTLKYAPPNRAEQRKADYLKHYKTDQQRKEDDILVTENYYDGMLRPLTDELNRETNTELQQPAIINKDYSSSSFKGFVTDEKDGRTMVVINTDYFKLDLPRYTPQFIVLYWSWTKDAPNQDFKKQFEENFPVDQLKAMIDK